MRLETDSKYIEGLLDHMNGSLEHYFESLDPSCGIVVAFSGGVDSTLIAYAAKRWYSGDVRLVFFDSVLLGENDRLWISRIATTMDWKIESLRVDPLQLDAVKHNRADRCYHCKHFLFSTLRDKYPEAIILDGTNFDDKPERRPGMRALSELGILSPLRECGITKVDVRKLATIYDLPNASRPSAPCLAVDIACDTTLTAELLLKTDVKRPRT